MELQQLFNIKVLSPNAKQTHRTFTKSGKSTAVKSEQLEANPVLILKSYPGLRTFTSATTEQMSLIEGASRNELIAAKSIFDQEKAVAFQLLKKAKLPSSKLTESNEKPKSNADI